MRSRLQAAAGLCFLSVCCLLQTLPLAPPSPACSSPSRLLPTLCNLFHAPVGVAGRALQCSTAAWEELGCASASPLLAGQPWRLGRQGKSGSHVQHWAFVLNSLVRRCYNFITKMWMLRLKARASSIWDLLWGIFILSAPKSSYLEQDKILGHVWKVVVERSSTQAYTVKPWVSKKPPCLLKSY